MCLVTCALKSRLSEVETWSIKHIYYLRITNDTVIICIRFFSDYLICTGSWRIAFCGLVRLCIYINTYYKTLHQAYDCIETYDKGSSSKGAKRLILAQLIGLPISLYRRVMIDRNGCVLRTHSINPPFSLKGITAWN